MSERDRGDRPKKSWRELDAARDRAGPRPSREDRDRARPGNMDARASKQYRAALDALFEKGEVGKLAEKLGGSGARVDPLDVVRGAQRGGGSGPALSGASGSGGGASSSGGGASSSGGGASSRAGADSSGAGAAAASSEREAPASAAKTAPPPAPAKEDGRAALRKKVIEALGRDEISRAIDRYVKAHGWPNDFEVLEQALEHLKTERQAEAMDQLDKLLAREKPKRSRTLAGKLRFIEETSDAPELREQAARVRAKL